MSTTLDTVSSTNHVNDVHVDSFSGGQRRGRMLQLVQSSVNRQTLLSEVVQMDEAQVRRMVSTMQEWLND